MPCAAWATAFSRSNAWRPRRTNAALSGKEEIAGESRECHEGRENCAALVRELLEGLIDQVPEALDMLVDAPRKAHENVLEEPEEAVLYAEVVGRVIECGCQGVHDGDEEAQEDENREIRRGILKRRECRLTQPEVAILNGGAQKMPHRQRDVRDWEAREPDDVRDCGCCG
jgi:hypothetical protein